MKKYKVVEVSTAERLESSLNELAGNGWKVLSANMAYAGASGEATYFALLESKSAGSELREMMEENTENLEQSGLSPSAN